MDTNNYAPEIIDNGMPYDESDNTIICEIDDYPTGSVGDDSLNDTYNFFPDTSF